MLKKLLLTLVIILVLALGALAALIYFHEDDPSAPKHVQSAKIPLVIPGNVELSNVKPTPVKPATSATKEKMPAPTPKAKPVETKPAPTAAPAKPAPTKTAKATAGNWIINVASFTEPSPAEALKNKLTKDGLLAYRTGFMKDGTQWYRVRVGFYTSKELAQKTAAQIKAKHSHTGWITKASDSEKQKNLK